MQMCVFKFGDKWMRLITSYVYMDTFCLIRLMNPNTLFTWTLNKVIGLICAFTWHRLNFFNINSKKKHTLCIVFGASAARCPAVHMMPVQAVVRVAVKAAGSTAIWYILRLVIFTTGQCNSVVLRRLHVMHEWWSLSLEMRSCFIGDWKNAPQTLKDLSYETFSWVSAFLQKLCK